VQLKLGVRPPVVENNRGESPSSQYGGRVEIADNTSRRLNDREELKGGRQSESHVAAGFGKNAVWLSKGKRDKGEKRLLETQEAKGDV